jgi:hypothetical protein
LLLVVLGFLASIDVIDEEANAKILHFVHSNMVIEARSAKDC